MTCWTFWQSNNEKSGEHMRWNCWQALGATIFWLISVQPEDAWARCDTDSLADELPEAGRAVARWETTNKAHLSRTALRSTLMELCQSVRAASEKPGADKTRIAAASEAAILDYLGREYDSSLQPRSVGAAFRSALGVSGFSRPTPRRLGKLKVLLESGQLSVIVQTESDSGEITTDEVTAPTTLMLSPGSITVLRKGSSVCGRKFPLGPGSEQTIRC